MKNALRTSIILLALSFSGCATQKRCHGKWPTKDSVSIVVERHDSIVIKHDTTYVPYQDIVFSDESPCPPQVNYSKSVKSNGLTSTVTIKDGKLTSKCIADSLKAVIESKDYYILTLKTELSQKVEEIPIRDFWYNFWKVLGIVSTSLLLIVLAGIIFRK